jgi:plastocyanin
MAVRLLASLLLLTAVATAGCSGEDSPPAGQVEIHGFAFDPATLTVQSGAVVHFVNHDSAPHTATADGGAFDSGTIAGGNSGEITAGAAGTYPYHCTIHPSMTGTLVVTS